MHKTTEDDELLAIDGGRPAFVRESIHWPPEDEGVADVLRGMANEGAWATYSGSYTARLIEALSDMHGIEHVRLTCSGTAAVEQALRGVGVGAGDEVILAAYDFSGNFRCVERIGARPVLVDISPSTSAADPALFDDALSPHVRAVVVSHLHSGLAPMPEVCDWALRHGVAVVEDACQAPGANVHGRPAGSWGDVGVLSFGGSKLLSAGRGGAILTGNQQFIQRMKVYAEGGNDAFPLSELQAAVLVPQLERLPERNERRRAAVQRIAKATKRWGELEFVGDLSALPCPSYFKVAWRYQPLDPGLTREQFVLAAQAEGLPIDVGFRGLTRRSDRRCRRVGPMQHATEFAEWLVVMHHPLLLADDEQIDLAVKALAKVMRLLKA